MTDRQKENDREDARREGVYGGEREKYHSNPEKWYEIKT